MYMVQLYTEDWTVLLMLGCQAVSLPSTKQIVAKSMAIALNKMSYVVAYGLRSYFTDMTIRELMEG